MTQRAQSARQAGPEGSIFLPKTDNPVREFSSWEAQISLGRGIGEGLTYSEQLELYEQLVETRAHYLGEQALATTVDI